MPPSLGFPALLATVAMTVAMAAAPTIAAQATTPPPITIGIPDSIADFAFHSRHDYEDPAAGVSLRYVGPDSLYVDVFVYPGPDLYADCDPRCALDVMEREIAGFTESFPEMIRRGYVDTIFIQRTDTLAPGPGAPWLLGRHLTLAVHRENEARRSDFRLIYLSGYRIKSRVTFAPNVARSAAMLDFYDELIPAMVRPPQLAEEDEDDEGHIAMSVRVPGRRDDVTRRVEGTLRQLGWTVPRGSPGRAGGAGSRRISTAVRQISAAEDGSAMASPIRMVVNVELTAAGDSTEVSVSAISLDRDGPNRATARRLELTTALILMASLSPTTAGDR